MNQIDWAEVGHLAESDRDELLPLERALLEAAYAKINALLILDDMARQEDVEMAARKVA